MARIPSELVEQFAAGTTSIFAGAGISIEAGMPNWASLMEPLWVEFPDCPPNTSFLDLAQFYENDFHRLSLTEKLRNKLNAWGNNEPTALHSALINLLPTGRIYTTNLDTLLESAATVNGTKFRKIVNTDPPVSFDYGRLNIVKLHGDVEQPLSYVVTAQDYESYSRKYPGMTRLVAHEFQTGTVLFIGYSHSDMDLRMILRQITDENGQFSRNHYSLQINPSRPIVSDLQRRGIQVISIHCDPDPAAVQEAVTTWLQELHAATSTSSASAQLSIGAGPALKHNIPVPAHSKLFGRTGEADIVIGALATPGYSIVAIDGFTGVGKTALAHDIGLACLSEHGSAARFEYVAWVSANKPDQKRWLTDVLNVIAGVTGQRFTESSATYNANRYQLIDSKKVLIVINNYEAIDDPDLTHWIEHLPDPSRVLIMTRAERSLARCRHITLQGLGKPEAVEFAQEHARSQGFLHPLQERDIDSLAEVSAGNPQVIKLALGLVKGGTKRLSAVVAELRGIPGRTVQVQLLDALFDWTWGLLSDDAKTLLMITTLFVGTSVIRLEALYDVSEIESDDFERALGQLHEFKLLEPTYDGRFITHSMTRAFARNKLEDRPELRRSGRQACIKSFFKIRGAKCQT